jgi:hypothetical protein
MTTVTIYKTETGLIDRTITVQETDILINCQDGEFWVEGEYSPNEYIIQNGQPYTLPVKPSYPTTLDLETLTWVQDNDRLWANLRYERAVALQNSDWTQVPDAPLTEAKKLEWQVYRQALRDLPDNVVDMSNPIYPTPPA